MQPSSRGEGISEVIGFLLILAVVILTISLYLLYAMPAMGREEEISRMTAVKEAFTEYKLNIDTLWTSRQCTSEYGPALSIGSGESTGILSFFPFFRPPRAGGVLSLNMRPENITITSDSYYLVSSAGYNESQSLTSTPITVSVNSTPVHFYMNISTTDLLTERGILIDGPDWDIKVNVTPNYDYTNRFNISTFTPGTPSNITKFWNWTEYVWNSTDVTVTTLGGGRVARTLTVYRDIRGSTEYRVDLMSPVYGVSSSFGSPQGISMSLSDNTGKISGKYEIRYGFSPTIVTSTSPLGSIEYRSNNLWYTPQNFYYQLGGVFLEQEDGSTNEIPPAISISVVNSSPVVSVGELIIRGGVTSTQVTGSGPITVASAVTDAVSTPLAPGNNTRWVNITVQAASAKAAQMWNRTLAGLADQGGLTVPSYTSGVSGTSAFINITGNPNLYDVRLSLTQVNVSADYVEEYSPGEVGVVWRNVPGFAFPTTPGSGSGSGLNATTTTLSSTASYINLGTTVTFTATVTGSIPDGTVTFNNGSVALGTVALSSGSASLSVSDFPVGSNSVTATYNGNSYYATSSSSAVVVTVTTPPAGYVTWKDCAWAHRKNITIDKSKVVGTHTDFPVLINFTSDSDLATYAKTNGQDILFTKDDGVTQLSHEIELYQPGTGGLVAWVKIPSLSGSANTSIYMYYGNSAASPQWQNTSVWSSGYVAVWHLKESGVGTAGEFKDSSSNANNGRGGSGLGYGTPARTAGKIGFGQDLTSGSSQFIQVPDAASLQITGPLTVEGWVYGHTWSDPGGGYRSTLGRQYGTGAMDSYEMAVSAGGANPSTPFAFLTGTGLGWGNIWTNTWTLQAFNYTTAGTAPLCVFVNGASGCSSGYSISTDSNPVIIGGQENDASSLPTHLFDGVLDEVRISNVARSDPWIRTEYNNQNSPSTFAYRMPQESSSCAPAFVQINGISSNSFSGTQFTVPFNGATTTGNLIVVSFGYYNSGVTASSVTDSKGNLYSQGLYTPWTASARAYTYYAANAAGGGSHTVTITLSGDPGVDMWGTVAEYSGIATTSPLDQTSGASGSGAGVVSSGTRTTTQASELIYGYGLTVGTITPNAPLTGRSNLNGDFVADRTVSSTGTYEVTGTNSGSFWGVQMLTFRGK